jgi:hypothetical protein
MKVKVSPKSTKGRNRIREHGEIWTVRKQTESAICLNGPGMLLEAPDGYLRWVALPQDPHWNIIEV